MKVTAVVPAFNAAQTLARAVTSLLETGYVDLEILVVDDGSSDSTNYVAQQLAVAYPKNVRVLSHAGGANLGVSASRNLGMAAATGELICFLDADDFVYQHRFAHCIPLLCAKPEVDGVYELSGVVLEGSIEDTGRLCPRDDHTFGLTDALQGPQLLQELLRGYPWHPGSFIFRRQLLRRSGVFNERLHMAEDCHLWFRMAAVGTIVPGNMIDPVSSYVRHGANTYYYSLERKVDLVVAMLDALTWIRRHADRSVYAMVRQCVSQYILNAIIQTRESEQRSIAWALLGACVRAGSVLLLLDFPMMRQLAWLGRETFLPSRAKPSESPTVLAQPPSSSRGH